MLKSIEEICNTALSHIRNSYDTITDFENDDGVVAEQLRLHYDTARRSVLEIDNWGFALKQEKLALLCEQDMGEYRYRYSYPAGCLVIRRIEPSPVDRNSSPYQVIDNDGDGLAIITNVMDAEVYYTHDAENTQLFSTTFTKALEFLLATLIAPTLSEDDSVLRMSQQAYEQVLTEARTINSSQRQAEPAPLAPWHEAQDNGSVIGLSRGNRGYTPYRTNRRGR